MEKFTPKERTGGTTHCQGFNKGIIKMSELEFKTMIRKILDGLKKHRRH